jgi:hypothetical protein
MKSSMKWFIFAIAAMGVVRFALTVAGVPNTTVKFASMSVIIILGTLYFGVVSESRKERLNAAYLLILPYMVIEVAALAYTWVTGQQTIFHANEYSLGFGIREHTIGHLVGGLTWEPFFIFVAMEVLSWIAGLRGRASRPAH